MENQLAAMEKGVCTFPLFLDWSLLPCGNIVGNPWPGTPLLSPQPPSQQAVSSAFGLFVCQFVSVVELTGRTVEHSRLWAPIGKKTQRPTAARKRKGHKTNSLE